MLPKGYTTRKAKGPRQAIHPRFYKTNRTAARAAMPPVAACALAAPAVKTAARAEEVGVVAVFTALVFVAPDPPPCPASPVPCVWLPSSPPSCPRLGRAEVVGVVLPLRKVGEVEVMMDVVLDLSVEGSPLAVVENELDAAGSLLGAAGPGPGTKGSWVTPRESVQPLGTGSVLPAMNSMAAHWEFSQSWPGTLTLICDRTW